MFGVGANGSRIAGKPESLKTSRSLAETSWTSLGITWLTWPSTAEPRIADDSHGTGTEASGTAINQITIRTAHGVAEEPEGPIDGLRRAAS